MRLATQKNRRGATAVEVAVIIPVMVVILALAIDVTTGVFRFHQVATLARAGARYAAVHAGQYAAEQSASVVTQDQLKQNVILPQSVGLASNLLTCTLAWIDNSSYPWTDSSDTGARTQNRVRVVVSYQWQPMFLFGTPLTLTSTSEMTISY
jgi:Flp pilus assembly protein TadG